MAKFVFVTGGVSSSLGKGLTASSLGRLLKSRGLRVTMCKLDPYINFDPGTMNPFEHGEVFVTDDGGETDLDLGHYERFIDENLHRSSNATTGQIYSSVIAEGAPGRLPRQDRPGDPAHHRRDQRADPPPRRRDDVDVVIVEVGGTVGDIEIVPFLEAIRQFRREVGRDNVCYVHLTLVPYLGAVGRAEDQADPALGHRAAQPGHPARRHRLPERPADLRRPEAEDLAPVRRADRRGRLGRRRREHLRDPAPAPRGGARRHRLPDPAPRRAGAPRSTSRAGRRSSSGSRRRPRSCASASSASTSTSPTPTSRSSSRSATPASTTAPRSRSSGSRPRRSTGMLAATPTSTDLDGIVIPGGFGERGIEGKIAAAGLRPRARHALPRALPRAAGDGRRVRPLRSPASRGRTRREFDPATPYPVIDLMDDQADVVDLGGTMRLGAYPAHAAAGLAGRRHLRRDGRERAPPPPLRGEPPLPRPPRGGRARAARGPRPTTASSSSSSSRATRFWVGTQAHPEFKSRPDRPHPLFRGLVGAALDRAHGSAPRV